jgi:hypothetical protein
MDLGVVDPRVKEARLIASATDDDIKSYVVEGITYASLAQGPHAYIQCAVREEPPYGFWLAYVDGTEEKRHHAMEVPIRLDQVQAAFLKYRHGDESWRLDFSWGILPE